ncbi:uncharacterized protein K444DRAFT_554213 [Hyaloscypha bicolor E]|uniref:Heterokaryon incompatibility domain-containing protein n=1 Tax=Hyaloscypha bicolor E TaxID=1095630 RepID=A0A2J6TPA9_9HELO|nr:uncharacterized protein K444DRAFT_554213 [Hyaloscypha bicolor E]PMD64854.1 hypothetical protein K444DRAFT_554213 [Hyaloscypha bicolor E]
MTSAAKARKVIEDIRRDITLDGSIGEEKSILLALENALEVLSQQIYNTSTHFLRELIQNADDNTFKLVKPDARPTLNFTYKKGVFRVDSNEVGFSIENVQAICTIGQSTKDGIGFSKQHIGEKGIGFKSVFRVAKVVSISSGNFSFKFDKAEQLGLIAPIWAAFPEKILPGFTSFHLQLDNYEEELVQELKNLDPRVLIFLRKLKEINITITDKNGKTSHRKLQRTDVEETDIKITTLHEDNRDSQYLVTKHRVIGLPVEPKRPKCSESEILLAFPVTDFNTGSTLDSQSVYAFLPIKSYGFRFLLHGEFLLTASRQDIDTSSSWNRVIRNAAADAFVKTMKRLNSGKLKYYWPRYLPVDDIHSFFDPVKNKILERLAKEPLLHSCEPSAEIMAIPSSLIYVPQKKFAGADGTPFTLSSHTATTYLSLKYPDWVIDKLCTLKVKILSPEQFLRHLAWMISHEPGTFRGMPKEWHSQLAKVLLKLATERAYRELILDMEIIPLRRSQPPQHSVEWVSARNRRIFFSKNARGLDIPSSVIVMADIVDQEAEDDFERQSLFRHLHVTDCDTAEISKLIIEMHSQEWFKSLRLDAGQLLSHALFLYKSSWCPRPGDQRATLWLATTKKGVSRLSLDLYIHGTFDKESTLANITKQLEKRYLFVHPSYLEAVSNDTGWLIFLCKSFGLERMPRLVTNLSANSPDHFKLSEDFKFVFDSCTSVDALELLRDHWQHYSRWIEDGGAFEDTACRASKVAVRAAIGALEAVCHNGCFPLQGTLLPAVDHIVDESPFARTLKIRDPENQQWEFLKHFGVAVKRDIHYYLRCLKHMTGTKGIPEKTVTHIYERIQYEYPNNNGELIFTTFQKHNLIYTKRGSAEATPTSCWLSLDECIARKLNIEAEYPQCTTLFRCLLAGGEGEVGSLIAEITLIKDSTELSRISELFTKANQAMAGMSGKKITQAVNPLRPRRVFPILERKGDAEFDSLKVLGDDNNWFVADLDHLRECFLGVVGLLAFSADDLESMDTLLSALDLDFRRLSLLVKSETTAGGITSMDWSCTEFLRARSGFVIPLIPKAKANRDAICSQIRRAKVKSAERIVQRNVLLAPDGVEFVGSGVGEVAFISTTESLEIFMTAEEISDWEPPLALVEGIADRCGIEDASHRSLLQKALGNTQPSKLISEFRKRGIHVNETTLRDAMKSTNPKSKYAALSGDVSTSKSPFPEMDLEDDLSAFLDGLSSSFRRTLSGIVRYGDSPSVDSSRSLPFMDFTKVNSQKLHFNGITDRGDNCAITTRATLIEILYLGELITSNLFQNALGKQYDPEIHWTSLLRHRAGYKPFTGDTGTSASFTISDRRTAQKVAEFLTESGYWAAVCWKDPMNSLTGPPTFHFDIAVTPGDEKSTFSWDTSQLERMRKFRMDSKLKEMPKDVLILVRVCNAYVDPRIDLFVDPWSLYTSDRFVLPQLWGLTASIEDKPPSPTSNAGAHRNHQSSWCNTTQRLAPVDTPWQPNQSMWDNMEPTLYDLRPFFGYVNGLNQSSETPSVAEPASHATQFMKPLKVSNTSRKSAPPLNYKYKHLKDGQMRLLSLLPGPRDAELRGVVYHASLKDPGDFRALSYTWGTTDMTNSMWTPDGTIKLTLSLHAALKCVRHPKEPMVLWVDALCINQDENDQEARAEKAKQIRLLPRIFQNSTCVLAFLGNDEQSDAALETLMQIQAKDAIKENSGEWPDGLSKIPPSWDGQPIPLQNDPIWTAIGALFERPWFRRAWVIQEVVVAPSVRVICGAWIVDWNDLFSAVEVIQRVSDVSSDVFSLVRQNWAYFITLAKQRELEANKTRLPLFELLESFRYTESTWQRDHFFALLGLASDGENSAYDPDYSSYFEVIVRRFACALAKKEGVVELLYRAGINSEEARFPSWIPNWTETKQDSLYSLSSRGTKWAAALDTEPNFQCDPNSDELKIYGLLVDRVASVSFASNLPEELKSYVDEVNLMVDSLSLYSQENSADLKWKIPIAGASHPRTLSSANLDMRLSYEALRDYLAQGVKEKSVATGPPARIQPRAGEIGVCVANLGLVSLKAKAQNYLSALQENFKGWKFLITEKGYAGIAPPGVRRDDIITIFHGGAVPFITRSSKTHGAFQLVGECYVHGMMNGEGIRFPAGKVIGKGMLRLH